MSNLTPNRPMPDGSYPFEGGAWARVKSLGSSEKEGGSPGQKAAEQIVGFSLNYWTNKTFYVYEVKEGVGFAISLHDDAWYVIVSNTPETMPKLRRSREGNLAVAKVNCKHSEEQLRVAREAGMGSYTLGNYVEHAVWCQGQLEMAAKGLKFLTDNGV